VALDQLAGQAAIQRVALAAAGPDHLAETGQAFRVDQVELQKRIRQEDRQQGRARGLQTKSYFLMDKTRAQRFKPLVEWARLVGQAHGFGLASGRFQEQVVMGVGPIPADPRDRRRGLRGSEGKIIGGLLPKF
jgi:hypothetical protein